MTDARMVATNTHRRWLAVQSAGPRADRMTCSSHGLALGLIKTRCLPVQSLHLTILLEKSVQLAMFPRSKTRRRFPAIVPPLLSFTAGFIDSFRAGAV